MQNEVKNYVEKLMVFNNFIEKYSKSFVFPQKKKIFNIFLIMQTHKC